MEPSWPAIVGITLTGVAMITGASVAYLRLFVKGAMSEQREAILGHIDEKFALKELMIEKFASLEANINVKFSALEGRVEALERRS